MNVITAGLIGTAIAPAVILLVIAFWEPVKAALDLLCDVFDYLARRDA